MAFTTLFNSGCVLVLACLFQTSKVMSASCDTSCCPSGMIQERCSCQTPCGDPIGMTDCRKICEETCVAEVCYVPEDGSFILNGDTYVNLDCSQRCTCNDGHLNCDSNYQCHSDAACGVKNNVRQCYCNDGYEGDGISCRPISYTDCNDVKNANITQSGVYYISPTGWLVSPFAVYCNMTIDGGGWTVFQRRIDGTTDFYRNWDSYKNGFGNIQQEFWLGNEKLFYLTRQATYEYRADYVLSSDSAEFHKYTRFRIDNEANKYKVTDIGSHTGSGNSLENTQNIAFSTYDEDNDGKSSSDCAEGHRSGWWHSGYYDELPYGYCYYYTEGRHDRVCSYANLNGDYNGGKGKNIFDHNYCNIKYTELKIRRTS